MTLLDQRPGIDERPQVEERPGVPPGMRPSLQRAAAAARLAGAAAGEDAVAARMRYAAIRARTPEVSPVVSSGSAALAVAEPLRRPEARPRHLRVVPDAALSPAQRRRRARALLITGVGLAAAIALALVYFHVVLAQRQFALDHLNSQVQQAQSTYQSRRLEVAQLGSPQHIISTAEGELGMVQPAKVTYLTPSGSTGGTSGSVGTSASARFTGLRAQAPTGDADWPTIKSQLAGTP